ncbi:unnamed protein product [Anisakis simplex]|uniref:Uncharacterized protein n=1 Tax=Anisakis simplex TaxID=6269 RepID=A0A3P6RAF1_ANISI|nr:unnamed protein product [Anisakis simplex]
MSRRRATVDGRNSGTNPTSATCSDNSSTTGSSKYELFLRSESLNGYKIQC